MTATKVSIVVPTYSPGQGLDRVVASLDGQTMSADEFEVIFVDDGSPDDTHDRLLTLATSHPNYVVRRIENSGWPSRPRNIGLDLAQGDYVLFMDHDDYLYPDALRSAHAFAVEQRADVLSAKETRTSDWFAYEGVFLADIPGDAPKKPAVWGPWTTHKLFRREFLLEHGIRFQEGRRALFEDVLVGISAYVHSDRLAVLASEPFYQWVHSPGANYSGTYGRDVGEYLRSIGRIMDHAEIEAAGTPFAGWVRGYQYRLRILGQLLGPGMLSRTQEERVQLVADVAAFIDEYTPPELDSGLNEVLAARANLVRRRDVEGLVALAQADRGIKPVPVATGVEWDKDGSLSVEVEVRWQDHSGGPLRLRRDGDRLLRTFPAGAPSLPDDLIDVTDIVPRATAHLTVADRDKTGWPTISAPSETTLEDAEEGQVTPVTRFTAVINRGGSELGRPLGPGPWNIACRASLGGYGGHREVEFGEVAQVRGQGTTVCTVHATAKGHLVMALDGFAASVLSAGEVEPKGAVLIGERDAAVLRVPVTGAGFGGSAALAATAFFRTRDGGGPGVRRDGRLMVADGQAYLELPTKLPRGRYAVRVQVRGRQEVVDVGVDVIVHRLDRVSLARSSAESASRSPLRKAIAPVAAKLTGVVAVGRRRS
ncbi:glycosyltransferase [Flexivirga alba]|uniref:Glycosyltransferase n=1 Tax=Flexivirga alba TaxID=702742 RepID=A0ABW2ALL5_9MICO